MSKKTNHIDALLWKHISKVTGCAECDVADWKAKNAISFPYRYTKNFEVDSVREMSEFVNEANTYVRGSFEFLKKSKRFKSKKAIRIVKRIAKKRAAVVNHFGENLNFFGYALNTIADINDSFIKDVGLSDD